MRQVELRFPTRGGARPGAGRPRKAGPARVSHLRRPSVSGRHPVHVTLSVKRSVLGSKADHGVPALSVKRSVLGSKADRGVPALSVKRSVLSLRGSSMFRAVKRALAGARERFGFRLVHFSVQRDHLHLLAEVQDRRALARGVQGLSIRVAKAVNRRVGRRGKVFADRYHARALRTPRETRMALRYVLMNAKKHLRESSGLPAGFVDSRSSAPWFDGWNRPRDLAFVGRRGERDGEVPVMAARTWLLRVGWRRDGPLDVDERPA